MQVNGFDSQSDSSRKRFIRDTVEEGNELGGTTGIYLLEMAMDQTGESFVDRKAARSAAVKKLKATVETEIEKRNRGQMTEAVPDDRTFDQMFFELRELMVKFQQEFTDHDIYFLSIFDHEHRKICVLVSKQFLVYKCLPQYKTLFKTPEELNRFASKEFESAFFRALLASIDTRNNELKRRDALELEFDQSKSSQDLSNDNYENDDNTDYSV